MKKSDFFYQLPDALIAQHPLAERHASRMLQVDSSSAKLTDNQFVNFIDQVNSCDLLVFNNTKVIPARLLGHKQTGGKVEVLIERIIDAHHALAHIRASKAPKPDSRIEFQDGYQCQVLGREDDLFKISFDKKHTVHTILEAIGHIPLPPYIDRADQQEDQLRYQTIYAEHCGAVAAPTAGLHFDAAMMQRIKQKGAQIAFVTLHVGSGTFQPVRVENLAEHIMHKEYYEVPEATVKAVQQTRNNDGRIFAIGTTSVRALESASLSGSLRSGFGDTDLFITPGYQFKSVDMLLTNFHLPESTLLMLVSAFAGYELIMSAYQHAIAENYRFFSYGDAMLISRRKKETRNQNSLKQAK
jgi:S-adenosylmethionine:tRNA ribosyltransferase-isomerase